MSEPHDLLPLVRKKVGDFLYPYGSFPDDDFEQQEGYETEYGAPPEEEEPSGERYRTEVLVSAEKLVPLFLELCGLLPETIYVALERASADVYTRWDEFVSDEVPRDKFLELVTAYQFTFAEDGNLGVGAFSHDPAIEVFMGSHKELVIFSPDRKRVGEILRKHGLEPRKLDPYYRHDHTHLALTDYRGLRGDEFDFLHVADVMRHVLGLELQQDEDANVDDEGNELGLVAWHAVAVVLPQRRARARRRGNRAFLQEFGLTASSRREAREILERRLERDGSVLQELEELFRIDVSALPAHVQPSPEALQNPGIWYVGEKTPADPHVH